MNTSEKKRRRRVTVTTYILLTSIKKSLSKIQDRRSELTSSRRKVALTREEKKAELKQAGQAIREYNDVTIKRKTGEFTFFSKSLNFFKKS